VRWQEHTMSLKPHRSMWSAKLAGVSPRSARNVYVAFFCNEAYSFIARAPIVSCIIFRCFRNLGPPDNWESTDPHPILHVRMHEKRRREVWARLAHISEKVTNLGRPAYMLPRFWRRSWATLKELRMMRDFPNVEA